MNTIGNAPRILPDSARRCATATDLAINKDFRTGGSSRATLRIEVLNLFNQPWYAALSSTNVQQHHVTARSTTQGNLLAVRADHASDELLRRCTAIW